MSYGEERERALCYRAVCRVSKPGAKVRTRVTVVGIRSEPGRILLKGFTEIGLSHGRNKKATKV